MTTRTSYGRRLRFVGLLSSSLPDWLNSLRFGSSLLLDLSRTCRRRRNDDFSFPAVDNLRVMPLEGRMLNGIYLIVTGKQAVEGVSKIEPWMAKRHRRTSNSWGVYLYSERTRYGIQSELDDQNPGTSCQLPSAAQVRPQAVIKIHS